MPESSSVGAGDSAGRIRPGSESHKRLFCRTLLDTFDPYKPAVIDWPELDAPARERLVGLPIWDIALQTEGRARLNVTFYAKFTRDRLLREAIELNPFERTMPLWRRPWFELKVLAVWAVLAWERLRIARDVGNGVQDSNFTVNRAKSVGEDIGLQGLIDLCLTENQRRTSAYDRRLLRPAAVPALARLVRRLLLASEAARASRSPR